MGDADRLCQSASRAGRGMGYHISCSSRLSVFFVCGIVELHAASARRVRVDCLPRALALI
jgi:hypothetical protein